jgi:enoyl-CoA hydratase/carnithine racemase
MLFELESLLAWCTTRVEINSIFIDSSTSIFSTGLELDHLVTLSAQQLDKINTKLQKIIFAMMQLPQTVIMDLGDGTETLGTEFSLGADIRISSKNARVCFNHGHYGLVPAAGGMSMLSTLVTPAHARNWVLTGSAVDTKQSGFIAETYDVESRSEVVQTILAQITKVAPVQRIQSKLGLFETLRNQFEAGIVMDRKIAKASMVTEDWRAKKPEAQNFTFMPAKSMSYSVKLSLIKTEEPSTTLEH